MVSPIAPIRQRHVIIDTDEIDVVIRPQWVQMEIPVITAVLRLVPEIFAPVSGIADLGSSPQQSTHFSR